MDVEKELVLESIPVVLAEAVSLLVTGFKKLNVFFINVGVPFWEPRSSSTNDVENFFSMLKAIIGRDSRALRLVSSKEVFIGLRKATSSMLLKLKDNRGFEIPPAKRRMYGDYGLEGPTRHQKEQRHIVVNAVTRAEVGQEQHRSIRSFFKAT
jgi:hypothetical protein